MSKNCSRCIIMGPHAAHIRGSIAGSAADACTQDNATDGRRITRQGYNLRARSRLPFARLVVIHEAQTVHANCRRAVRAGTVAGGGQHAWRMSARPHWIAVTPRQLQSSPNRNARPAVHRTASAAASKYGPWAPHQCQQESASARPTLRRPLRGPVGRTTAPCGPLPTQADS